MKYSQNNEELIVGQYFGQFVGTLLSIGENDGETLSNALALIEKGWSAELVEPSPQVFPSLCNLHQYNNKVNCHQVAIGDRNAIVPFYDSGELLKNGDRALLSTAKMEETKRWTGAGTTFEEIKTVMMTFESFMDRSSNKTFDFISIDAEGFDMLILRQMDLYQLKCRCLCIEHNSLPAIVANIREHCFPFGFKEIGYNQENIIFAR